jgi:hypothetical protein
MKNELVSLTLAFQHCAAALGWVALAIKLFAILSAPGGVSELTAAINYFSYFTILSNIFAAATLTVAAFATRSGTRSYLKSYAVRTAIAVYMIVTGVGYALLLAGLSTQTELQYVADVLLHYVMPPLYLIAWLLWPARSITWSNALYFLVFPLLYGIYTLARGAFVGLYPYPFVNAAQLGYHAVLINYVYFLLLFFVLGVLLISVSRGRAKAVGKKHLIP